MREGVLRKVKIFFNELYKVIKLILYSIFDTQFKTFHSKIFFIPHFVYITTCFQCLLQ